MKFLNKILSIQTVGMHTIIYIFGIKIALRYFGVRRLKTHCDIENLEHLKKQHTIFTHPIGIVINGSVKVGYECLIRQNVTIGRGSYKESTGREYPVLGNRVQVGANAIIIGGITVGDDAIIGAGSVVVKDVPANAVVAGNPAKFIRYRNENDAKLAHGEIK